MDLFGELTPEEKAAEEKRKAEKEAKAKQQPVGQSQIVYDIKPWGEETDLKEMERLVREIKIDGLEWQGSEFRDVAYGVKKLVIICKVDDDKVNTEDIENAVLELEDYVQSIDQVAFNKV